MQDHPPLALTDAIIFTGQAFVEGHALLIKDGRIVDLVPSAGAHEGFRPIPLPHNILAPGFIDLQVNGGGNIQFNAAPRAESLRLLAAAHRKTGTTRLLPTVTTDAPEVAREAIRAVREACARDPSILGLHLEGPHISSANKGVHPPSFLRPLDEGDFALYAPRGEETVLLTLAPEIVTPADIHRLAERGIIVSLGHTAADPETIRAARKAGATGFTHLFNAMGPLSARDPGPAGVALTDDGAWCGIILDGHHVGAEMAQIALRCKPEDKLFMVSDANAPAGAETPESVMAFGKRIDPVDGACRTENGRLCGALLTLGQCVAQAIVTMKMDPARVLRMASTIPAAFIGRADRLGKLLPGYEADIVALDHSFRAEKVWPAHAAFTT